MSVYKEMIEEEKPLKCISKSRILKNLNVTCLGFFFLFCALHSNATLKTTINEQGSMSQSLIYIAQAFSALLFPKLVITKLGCKYTYLLSIITHIPFMISNYFGDFLSQFLTSIFLGLGGATLWSSACTYINEISALYSSQSDEPVDFVTTRFFGIFFMIFQLSQLSGNLVTFLILKSINSENTNKIMIAGNGNAIATCGINYCGEMKYQLSLLTNEKRFILTTVYLAFTVLSVIVVAIFLDQLQRNNSEKDSNILFSKLSATLNHMQKSKQILMIPITIFMGMEQAFILSDFAEGYIACAWGIKNISLVFIFYGVVSAVASILTGWLSKTVPRLTTLLTAFLGNVLACAIMFLWIPNNTDIGHFFIIIGLWGMSDAILRTVIFSTYGILFVKEEEAAFANLRLWEAIGLFIPYFFNKQLCMPSKLYLMMGMLFIGILGFVFVEIFTIGASVFSSETSKRSCK